MRKKGNNTGIVLRIMAHIRDRRMRAGRYRMQRKRILRRRKMQIKKYIGSRRFREDLTGCALGALAGIGIVLFYTLFGFM